MFFFNIKKYQRYLKIYYIHEKTDTSFYSLSLSPPRYYHHRVGNSRTVRKIYAWHCYNLSLRNVCARARARARVYSYVNVTRAVRVLDLSCLIYCLILLPYRASRSPRPASHVKRY